MANIISWSPKATDHRGGIRAETLSDLGLQVLLRVDTRLKLPCWHIRGMGPPFEGCKLLRLHPLCPSWGAECSPCQSPYTTKLPQLAPVQVAQAGQHGQLELRMGVVDHHPIDLDLLFGGARQCTEKAWCEDPLAFQEELFHFLVLRYHTVHINGHGILWVCFRSEDIALKGRPGLGRPDRHGLRFQKELFGVLCPSCLGFDGGLPPPWSAHGRCWLPGRRDNFVSSSLGNGRCQAA